MKITIKQEVDVPVGLYCKNCTRQERDKNGLAFCGVFNRYIYVRRGQHLKCRECVNRLYDEIDKEV